MKLFLGVLLLAALPIKSVVAYLRTAAVLKEDERLFHVFETCNRIELIEVSARVHYEKNEMIITRQITRDQFSTFVVLNGPYKECRKLQSALETGDSVFQITLKNVIKSYSKEPVDEEDVSLLAKAMSYLILPEDMQAALRINGAVNGALLGLATYLQRCPGTYQFILSSMQQSKHLLGISDILLMGRDNILSSALNLVSHATTFGTNIGLGQEISINFAKLVKSAQPVVGQQFVPIVVGSAAVLRQVYRLYQGEIVAERAAANVIAEAAGIAASMGGCTLGGKVGFVAGGPMGSAIGCLVGSMGANWVVGQGAHAYMRWLFSLPADAALENAYSAFRIPDWKNGEMSNHDINQGYRAAARRCHPDKGGSQEEFLQLAVHLEVIRLHRESLLVHKGPCDVPADQRETYATDVTERSCSAAKYTCFDPLEYTCYYRADRHRLAVHDLLREVIVFYNRLKVYCPDLHSSEVKQRKSFYTNLVDDLDDQSEEELEWYHSEVEERFEAEKNSDYCQTAK